MRPKKRAREVSKIAKRSGTTELGAVQRNRLSTLRQGLAGESDTRVMETLAAEASQRAAAHASAAADARATAERAVGSASELRKDRHRALLYGAIEQADVVLFVLDCRNPLLFRSESLEARIVAKGKRFLYVLNKIDTVGDLAVVERWKRYLSRWAPAVPFKCFTQKLRSAKASFSFETPSCDAVSAAQLAHASVVVGLNELIQLLTRLGRSGAGDAVAASTLVCVAGGPNAGKSSLIRTLTRGSDATRAGDKPGLTQRVAKIKVTNHISVLDTPGVLLCAPERLDELVLINAFDDFSRVDLLGVVEKLLRNAAFNAQLRAWYGLACSESLEGDELLTEVCKQLNFVAPGGRLDLRRAAQHVLRNCQTGKLRYFVEPPVEDADAPLPGELELSFSAEPLAPLDLDGMLAGALKQ